MERNLPAAKEIKLKRKTMKTFPAKIFLTVLLLLVSAAVLIPIGCDDSDSDYTERYDSRVTSATWNSFRTRYPNAYNVRWYIRGPYAVAYFTDTPGALLAGTPENAAWFRNDKGLWTMTEAEITFQSLPEAVKQAYSAGGYDNWIIDEVMRIERQDAVTLYAIEAFSGRTEQFLCYTESGLLAYALPDDDIEQLIPATLPESVSAYVSEHYPEAGLLNASVTTQGPRWIWPTARSCSRSASTPPAYGSPRPRRTCPRRRFPRRFSRPGSSPTIRATRVSTSTAPASSRPPTTAITICSTSPRSPAPRASAFRPTAPSRR